MVFENGVKNIQAAAYNGVRTVVDSVFNSFQMLFKKAWLFKAHSDCFMKK